MNVTCPYCNQPAQLVGGNGLYPNRPDLAHKRFWLCAKDAAWVGCHPGTERPLGQLANYELRQAKMEAHVVFDPLWKLGYMKRRDAYSWLASQLGIETAHIGEFDVETCRRVVEICRREIGNSMAQ